MTRIIIFFLLCLPLFATAQQSRNCIDIFTKDTFRNENIREYLVENWLFSAGDDPLMVLPGYDDSKWDSLNPSLRMNRGHVRNRPETFTIGWFRLHILTDSSLIGFPFALMLTHYGASEIYFDGKKIASFGIINGKDSSVYYDPQNIPFLLPIPDAGRHLLAVRYANYDADKNFKWYKSTFRGFQMTLGNAKTLIVADRRQTLITGFFYILFFGIFISLALSHLLLYLYDRTLKSDLLFSIFCASFAIGSLSIFLGRSSFNPVVQLVNNYVSLAVVSAGCFALAGFTNELFGKRKIQFRIITAFCILCPVIFFIHSGTGIIAYLTLIGTVTGRSIVLTTIAIYRKKKGAILVGTGILFFTLFVFTSLMVSIRGLNINDSTVGGMMYMLGAICAVLSIPVSLSLYLAWNFAGINKDLKSQLQQVQVLSEKTIEQEQEKKQILEHQKEDLEREVAARIVEVVAQKEKIEKQHGELKVEKKKSDDLLLNILPEEIAEELKEKGFSEAKQFNDVTVLFTDFVDFTKAGEAMSAQELVNELHSCFKTFDYIISKHNIEKIKTIGDAYLAVCGLPLPQPDHAEHVVKAGLEIIQFMSERKEKLKEKTFDVRVGIHSGSVVAGIVGVKKFAYDIWGDTVNTAARMEQNSASGMINISQTTYDLVKDKFECTFRGQIKAKNKGELNMYFITGLNK